jgi:broad specificity phosphatase PhoE
VCNGGATRRQKPWELAKQKRLTNDDHPPRPARKNQFHRNRISGYLPGVYLTDEGKAQAVRAAQYLLSTPISAVYSSPLERTMETATSIAEKFHIDIREVDFLKEINFGKLQGMGENWSMNPPGRSFKALLPGCVSTR